MKSGDELESGVEDGICHTHLITWLHGRQYTFRDSLNFVDELRFVENNHPSTKVWYSEDRITVLEEFISSKFKHDLKVDN